MKFVYKWFMTIPYSPTICLSVFKIVKETSKKGGLVMTSNQLQYWANKETERSNLAKEEETNRANVARETETQRNNLMNEMLTSEKNTEIARSNQERERQLRSAQAQDWNKFVTDTQRKTNEFYDRLNTDIGLSNADRAQKYYASDVALGSSGISAIGNIGSSLIGGLTGGLFKTLGSDDVQGSAKGGLGNLLHAMGKGGA